MKTCLSLKELLENYDEEIVKILYKSFKNVIKYHSLEDLKSSLYLHFLEKRTVERFRPLQCVVDMESGEWTVFPSKAKFSTFIITCIHNYIYAYFNRIDPHFYFLSLDSFNDNLFSEKDGKLKYESTYQPNFDSNLFLQKIETFLRDKTSSKGNFAEKRKIPSEVLKIIDNCGDKGCSYDKLADHFKEFPKLLQSLETNAIIQSKVDEKGLKKYYIKDVKRRSLYELFRFYMKGFRDTDISREFKMTVQGVGSMKRNLRKKISRFVEEQ